MRRTRRRLLAAAAAGLVTTAVGVSTVAAGVPALGAAAASGPAASGSAASGSAASAAAGPALRLIPLMRSVNLVQAKTVFVDSDIWLEALGAPFQIDVARASYTKPIQAFEIVNGHRRLLPSWVMNGWSGLRDFIQLQVRNTRGKVVASKQLTYCPNSFGPQAAAPASATTSPYGTHCGVDDPFPLSVVWGIARGWATDPTNVTGAETGPGPGRSPGLKLAPGQYRLTESVPPRYARLFGITARDRTAAVTLHVGKAHSSDAPRPGLSARQAGHVSKPRLPAPSSVPLLPHVPGDALPDLVPLPSWGISTSHVSRTRQDFLNFGATVWVGGHSPLDVEGFRTPGTSTMTADQYYWHDGRVVGRTRAGTMGFDDDLHWEFKQFAQYVLLNASKKAAVRSQKVGFCIFPGDRVNLALPGANWPGTNFLRGGQCGVPATLSVQEFMPVGWGDTYDQSKDGQAFNITHLADGTYYIEIIANPGHLLHEVTTANNVSLRKVIITGPAGHRQVRVPAWHGIDPEK